MATIFNDRRVRGVRLVEDGTTLHNNQPVIGVSVADEGVLFSDHERTLGVDVLDEGTETIHNDQPILGAVLIEDGRELYNNQDVVPAYAVTGSLSTDPIMVAAELVEGLIYGYSVLDPDLVGIPPGGSLSKEPAEGETVLVIFTQSASGTLMVSMDGDASEALFGKSVWIDGIEYISHDKNNNWGYSGGPLGTIYSVQVDFDFVPNQSYRVVIDSATFTSIRLQSIGGVLKYSDGSIGDPGGALSKQPLEGYDLVEFRYENNGVNDIIVASFSGDASHLSGAYTIFIDGGEFIPGGSDWVYDSENDITVYEGVGSVTMISGANHIMHVKQNPGIDPE